MPDIAEAPSSSGESTSTLQRIANAFSPNPGKHERMLATNSPLPTHWTPAPLTNAPTRTLASLRSPAVRQLDAERATPRMEDVAPQRSSYGEFGNAASSPMPMPPPSPIAPLPIATSESRWSRLSLDDPVQPPAVYGGSHTHGLGFSPYVPSPRIPEPRYAEPGPFTRRARRQPIISDDEFSEEEADPEYAASETSSSRKPGAFAGIMTVYGGGRPRREERQEAAQEAGIRRSDSLESIHYLGFDVPRNRPRCLTMHSEIIDEDDPRVTGKEPNRIDDEKRATESFISSMSSQGTRVSNGSVGGGGGGDGKDGNGKEEGDSYAQRVSFLLRLAKALMRYGAPSHRLESQLAAAARILEVDAQFMHMPSVVIANFGDGDERCSETHFIKAPQGLSLGKLHDVHVIYRRVMHHEIGAVEGTELLDRALKAPPIYGLRLRIFFAFLLTFLICPLAFHGSLVDALISGCGGAVLCWLQLHVAQSNPLYANVFEISVAILMAFIARGLSSIRSQMFCYEAISSAGVVLILPGYIILCSALELASKNIICGSVRMVYAIIYSLFIGFGLTIGSDLYLLLDSNARHSREIASQSYATMVDLHGIFTPDNAAMTPYSGAFVFSNSSLVSNTPSIAEGCYRNPEWPWYLQEFPWWTLFILVPVFSIVSSLGSMQPLKSKELPIMVFISCASFAANTAANYYIFDRSDVVSAIGAFVVGVLGNLYSRVFRGTAFTAMVTGVLFLVPSGLSAAGGLSQNYRGQDVDQFSNGLQIGVRMVQVSIGITVGLFGSGLLVYSFGRRKSAGTFAF